MMSTGQQPVCINKELAKAILAAVRAGRKGPLSMAMFLFACRMEQPKPNKRFFFVFDLHVA